MRNAVVTARMGGQLMGFAVVQDAQDEVQRQRVLKAKAIKKMQRVRTLWQPPCSFGRLHDVVT